LNLNEIFLCIALKVFFANKKPPVLRGMRTQFVEKSFKIGFAKNAKKPKINPTTKKTKVKKFVGSVSCFDEKRNSIKNMQAKKKSTFPKYLLK
jgi:hypothetical protein